MRTETIEKTYYKFDELSGDAKERAIEKFREFNSQDMPWQDENRGSLEAFEKVFPIKITDWEYGNRNYINFKMQVDHDEIEELTGFRLSAYLWNNYRKQIFKGKYYSTPGAYTNVKTDGKGNVIHYKYHYKSRYSKIILDTCCVLTGFHMDDILLKEIYGYIDHPDRRTFEELLSDCLHNWIKACNDEIEYQNSEEAIKETIEANDYEFNAEGNLQ